MKVTLEESTHTYTDDQGVVYTSVTTLLGRYKQPFDKEKIAHGYAKKHGKSAHYWIKKWDEERDEACDRGTEFHKKKEEMYLGTGIAYVHESFKQVENQNLYKDYSALPDGLYVELCLYLDYYDIAGTADMVILETLPDGTRIAHLDDHKTNKEIKTRGYVNPRTNCVSHMLHPVGHLEDCNFHHYELQLSFYMFMLEKQGFKPGKMQFTHYPHNPFPDDLPDPDPVIYPLDYRKREILDILRHFKN